MSDLGLEDFELEKVAYEVRYAPAYAMWDRSGRFATDLMGYFPDAKVVEAAPTRIIMKIGTKHQFGIELEQSRLISLAPARNLEETADVSRRFFSLITKVFEVASLLRVGTRFIYFKKMKSDDAASDALRRLDRLQIPQSLLAHLKESDRVLGPEVAFRVEGKALGSVYRLRAESRKIDVEPAIEVQKYVNALHTETDGISVDIDFHTTVPMKVSQFEAGEWLMAAHKSVKRDAGRLLNEER